MKQTWRIRLFRWAIIFIVGFYLLIPILAMLDFSLKPYGGGNQGRTLRAWKVIPQTRNLIDAISLSMSDRKSTRLNSSHMSESRMPSSA